ncbi:MAG: peptidylprolyl isomerase [Hyphomicrobiales bacterium]|nr:peptidylprolyl isomerase [Hyphomicrobiales bacterium]
MLTLLRKSVGTWVAKIFILLLVASFGVWGVSGAIIGGLSGSVIQVGKTLVSPNDYVLAYERARYGLSRQFGRLLTREEIRAFGIDANVMTQLLSGAVLDESARKMGLGLSDKNLASLIGEDETFQDASGNFDRRVLTQQLRQLGMSESDYVENRQAVAVRNQLLEGISSNAKTPQAFIDAYDSYRNEKRVFEYVVLSPDLLMQSPSPTPQDISSHYDENKTDYVAPEYRKIIVVKLEAEDISDPDSITAEEVAEEYEARKSGFTVEEKRSIQQLALDDDAQGKEILKRLADGELFVNILQELGKTEEEVNIGEYAKKDLPDANVGEAAFALKLNEMSDVVEGVFGPVLLRVTQISDKSVKPLSEVEDELRKRLALAKASEELFEIHDKLEDERAAGDNLSEAAAKAQLTPRTLEKIDAGGRDEKGNAVTDLPESTKLLGEAFKTAEGVEADPVSIGNSGFIWYEVKEVFPERQKKLEEVKDEVSRNWVEQTTASSVEKIASDLLSRLNSGEEFAAAYNGILPDADGEQNKGKIEKSAELSREDTSDDLSTAAIKTGFAIAGQKTAMAVGNKKGSHIVLKVVDIIGSEGNSAGPDEITRLDNAVADDLLSQLIGDLRGKETVTIDQNAIIAAQNLIR